MNGLAGSIYEASTFFHRAKFASFVLGTVSVHETGCIIAYMESWTFCLTSRENEYGLWFNILTVQGRKAYLKVYLGL